MSTNKTDNFLNAIQKYAEQQKLEMEKENEAFKAEEMERAENEGLQAAYDIIHKEMDIQKAEIARGLAKKEKESKDELFIERNRMMNEVFSLAKEKLMAYSTTKEYEEKLLSSAKEIAELFKDKNCTILINEKDLKLSDKLQNCFTAETQVKTVADIQIGGIKVYCENMAMIADETLDSKLEAQKQWFIENSALKVV